MEGASQVIENGRQWFTVLLFSLVLGTRSQGSWTKFGDKRNMSAGLLTMNLDHVLCFSGNSFWMALILHDQPSTRQWPKPLCAVEGKRGRTAVLYYFVVFLFVLLPHWHTEHLDGKQSARTLGLREFLLVSIVLPFAHQIDHRI
ncbi:hypothetical protein BB8028_0007g02840 [Beauveria bassiana]|uniref:Uncharacterized protein n=1 Tax=Beauveria bassiana TaxID=176275 RepID=A0A2S7YLM3_BEABA|nr:hypothetical protein BB8028_0007g02840 [Beauveria bassiana]